MPVCHTNITLVTFLLPCSLVLAHTVAYVIQCVYLQCSFFPCIPVNKFYNAPLLDCRNKNDFSDRLNREHDSSESRTVNAMVLDLDDCHIVSGECSTRNLVALKIVLTSPWRQLCCSLLIQFTIL